jgi:valyl-tRNA synthetase
MELRISCDTAALQSLVYTHQDVISSLEKISSLTVELKSSKPAFSASGMFPGGRIFMPLAGILDPAAEKTRLTKELGKAEGFAASQEKKLANESFVKSAPMEVVEVEREKLRSQKEKIEKLKSALADLG